MKDLDNKDLHVTHAVIVKACGSYVKISKGRRFNGGFATQRTDCWTVSLVRGNGIEKKICTGMNEWATYSQKHYAESMANEWALFLGWPVKRFEEVEKVTTTCIEVET